MEEYTDQGSGAAEFDINDPDLANYVPDINLEEVPQQMRPAPPPDGIHKARFRLGNREAGPVYIKFTKDNNGQIVDGKTIAVLSGRVLVKDEDSGEEREGAFLKDWYPTTQVFKGSSGSVISAIYFLTTGKPVPASNPKVGVILPDFKNAIETLFAEREYVDLWVQTRWIKSVPQTVEIFNEDGSSAEIFEYVLDENGFKVYDETKGEKKIKALMVQKGIQPELAHLWFDPVAQETRTVNAEVASLKDPSKFDHD